MPNKAIPGFTQVPIVAADILSVHHDRAAVAINVLIVYQVKDDQGTVRGQRRLLTTTANYPLSGAAALAACNTAEGT